MLHRRDVLFGFGGGVLALAGCSAQPSGGTAAGTALNFLLDWSLEPNYVGFLLARENGFFAAKGLDVTLQEGSGGAAAAQQIGLGTTYYVGSSSGGGSAIARSGGIPVKSLAVLFPNISTVIFSKPESPINTPQDLVGKRIGLVSGSVTVNQYRALLAVAGIDRARITEVGVNPDPSPLLTGAVDCLIDYREQLPASLAAAGTPMHELALSDFGVRQYGLNIIANDAALADDRAAFARSASEAIVEGYAYLRDNVDEAVALYQRTYPQKDAAYAQRSIQVTAQLLGSGPVGAQDAAGWEATLQSLRSIELIDETVTVEQVMA